MKKPLLYSFVLLIIYEVLLRIINIEWNTGQHQFNVNAIKVERMLIESDLPTKLLFGSSYSYRLNEDCWDTEILNVGLAGFSFLEGLELKDHFNIKADTILIEVNMLTRSLNHQFVDSYSSHLKMIDTQNAIPYPN